MLTLCKLAETIIEISLEKGGNELFFLKINSFLNAHQNYFLLVHLK